MDRHHQPHWSNFGILGGIFVGATVILTVLAVCMDHRRQVGRNYQTKPGVANGAGKLAKLDRLMFGTQVTADEHWADHASAIGAVTAAGVWMPAMEAAGGGGGGGAPVDVGIGGGCSGGGGGGW